MVLLSAMIIVFNCSDDNKTTMNDILSKMPFKDYLNINSVRTEPGDNGYTNYYFSTDNCKCITGGEFHVSVLGNQGSNNVMFFMEGGGAEWPVNDVATGLAVQFTFTDNISFKSRDAENPLHDWNIIYVPYCDSSIHSGNNEMMYKSAGATEETMHYFWGMRDTIASINVMKKLYPNPDKILVTGSSAGGFGTYLGWAMVKYAFPKTKTYILNDSGVGFWNPDDLATWNIILNSWQIGALIPSECTKCKGTVMTYLYETYMDYDSQVRIGMFSSYKDKIISQWFLKMNQDKFKTVLMDVTGNIKKAYPKRFSRCFINSETHTTYPSTLLPGFLFPYSEGLNHKINGVSMYDWIGRLVNDDPAFEDDLLE